MLKEIQENIEVVSQKLERLNENYHFLCNEARSNIDLLCSIHIEIEYLVKNICYSIKENMNKIITFFILVDTEYEIVFEQVSY